MSRSVKCLILMIAAGMALLLLPLVAEAQCSMCRAVLSGSNNARFIRNFNIGVLVLLVPPVSMFCTIFIVLRRHQREEVGSQESGVGSREDDRDADSIL